jgi:hypothetical protein
MTIGADLEKMAVGRVVEEARQVSAKLQNGSGYVATCPAHADLAKGVRLCLDLLVCVVTSTTCPRKNALGSGVATLAVLIVWKVIESVMAKHGIDVSGVATT